MKTKEEAAKKYIEKFGYKCDYDKICDITRGDVNSTISSAFLSGIEFSQRWIDVKHEFPPFGELIFVKYKYRGKENISAVYQLQDNDNHWYVVIGVNGNGMLSVKYDEVTHWRRIEL